MVSSGLQQLMPCGQSKEVPTLQFGFNLKHVSCRQFKCLLILLICFVGNGLMDKSV